jgi:DNA-binding transcriptional MerR regulator
MTEEEFSIQDLCDHTGLPRRTIHFYTQQEIIPPPISSGLGARYQRIHLVRLQLIPILREQGLRLDDIRLKFLSASLEDLETWLAGSSPQLKKHPNPNPAPGTPPAILPQTCSVYNLPQGVVIVAPNNLSPQVLEKIAAFARSLEQDYRISA